jgi:hypothetical protein
MIECHVNMEKEKKIKEYTEVSGNDILFEKLFGLLPNDDKIIYQPQGLFNRGILNDTGRFTSKKGYHYIEINRPGIYDILPKGLFHDKLDSTNNQVGFIEKTKKEKQLIRKLFLPLDSEVFSTITKIEKESINHYKYSIDSEIAFSLLQFYRIPHQLKILSLYEMLFIDFILKKGDFGEKGFGDQILKLIPTEISLRKLFINLYEATDQLNIITRFLNILPYAPVVNSNPKEIGRLLNYLLGIDIKVELKYSMKNYNSQDGGNKVCKTAKMNDASSSLLLGNSFIDDTAIYSTTMVFPIEQTPVVSQCLNGSAGELVELFFSFFIPFHAEYELVFEPQHNEKAEIESFFSIEAKHGEKEDRLSLVKKNILNSLGDISFENELFHSDMGVDLRLFLIEYFNLFYEVNFMNKKMHAHLNINTKI